MWIAYIDAIFKSARSSLLNLKDEWASEAVYSSLRSARICRQNVLCADTIKVLLMTWDHDILGFVV